MDPRDMWSRVNGSVKNAASGVRRSHPIRQAAVVGAAASILLAPLAAGSQKMVPPQNDTLARGTGGTMSAPQTGATGGRASLPWFGVDPTRAFLPTALTRPAAAAGGELPASVAKAYRSAEASLAQSRPDCHLPWWLLAGIGHVESGHAAGGAVDAAGRTTNPIFGPVLDGTTPDTAIVTDSDGGAIDGNTSYDRAVGPMQFMPGTWRMFGVDADGDGRADPHDIDDAALSAGGYLCSGGGDLRDPAALKTAILRYNPSDVYVRNVLAAGTAYRDGTTPPPVWIPPTGGSTTTTTSSDGPVVTAGEAPRSAPTSATDPAPRRSTTTPAPQTPVTRTTKSAEPRTAAPTPTRTAKPEATATTPPTTAPTPTKTTPAPTKTTPAPTTTTPSLPYCEAPAPASTTSPGTPTATSTSKPAPTPTTGTVTPTPPFNHTFGPNGKPSPIPTPTCIPRPTSSGAPTIARGATQAPSPASTAPSSTGTPTPRPTATPR